MKKLEKRWLQTQSIITRFFIVCLLVVLVLNVITPVKTTSEMENRGLAQRPTLSWETLWDGSFFKNYQTFESDQFVGRNNWIHFNYLIQKLSGVRKIQDVYLCHDQLMEEMPEPNQTQLKRNIQAINDFANAHKDINMQMVLAPNAISVQSDRLPAFADVKDQESEMNQITKDLSIQSVDVNSALKKHKDEYIYYKSDHHWTSLGAYYAAHAFNSNIQLNQYDKREVSNSFQGTLASKVGSINIKDEVDIYTPKKTCNYLVTYNSSNKQTRSIYNSKAFHQRDVYQVFFGGNEGMINISINNNSDKHLLLIKDSYANSLVQFLLPYYRTITIIDPRYYYDDLAQQMNKDMITDVLFVYNTNTFVQDTSLADCLGY